MKKMDVVLNECDSFSGPPRLPRARLLRPFVRVLRALICMAQNASTEGGKDFNAERGEMELQTRLSLGCSFILC